MLLLHGALIEPQHITHAKELAEREPIEGKLAASLPLSLVQTVNVLV